MTVEELIYQLQKCDPKLQVAYPDGQKRPMVVEQVIQTKVRSLFSGKLTRCVYLNPTMESIDRMEKRKA